MPNDWLSLSLLAALLGLALFCDIRTFRIPNWLPVTGMVAGLGCSMWAASGPWNQGTNALWLAVGDSLLGVLVGFALMFPMYALRAMGAGDVKLMAAIGAFLGPLYITGAALLTFVAGGILALAAALVSRSLPHVLGNLRLMGWVMVTGRSSGLSLRDIQTTGRLPYAIAITIGTALEVWLLNGGGWIFV